MTFPVNERKQENKGSSKMLGGIKLVAAFLKDNLATLTESLKNVHTN